MLEPYQDALPSTFFLGSFLFLCLLLGHYLEEGLVLERKWGSEEKGLFPNERNSLASGTATEERNFVNSGESGNERVSGRSSEQKCAWDCTWALVSL